MEWQEYVQLTKTLLAFNSLSEQNKEAILLMIDGMKFRERINKVGLK